jgi:hypothetical protein
LDTFGIWDLAWAFVALAAAAAGAGFLVVALAFLISFAALFFIFISY